jgi:mono/diheme cytochrome c family protein
MPLAGGAFMTLETSLVLKIAMIVAVGSVPIIGFVGTSHPLHSSPDAEFQSQVSTGRELFMNNCARCHGDDAKGDKGPDLTSRKRQSKWTNSDEPIVNKINKGGLFMPKFEKKLTSEQIKEIAQYVRSLGK